MSRGAIYSRDSRDDGAESFGIDSQTKFNLQYADKHGITVPEDYILEDEWTGTEFSRPKFDFLKRLIEDRAIDAVIVYKVNRISRIDYHALMFLREYCFRNKVELHIVEWGRIVKDDSQDSTLFSLQALFGHIERDDIVKRTQRGRREKAEQGIFLGQGVTVYGYEKHGTKKNTILIKILEEEAVIVMIYGMFVYKGISIVDITRFLNAQGYPSPSQAHGRLWQSSEWKSNAVLRILRDSRYMGDFYAFRYVKNPDSGKFVNRNRDEQIKQHFPNLAIVDRDLFNAAQEIIDSRKNRFTFVEKYDYLFNKRLWCACGHKAGVQTMNKNDRTHQYYRCAHKRRIGVTNSDCKIPYMDSIAIDRDAWDKIEAFIRNPEIVLQELRDAQQAQKQEHQDAIMTLESLERIRKDHTLRLNRLYSDYESGLIPKDVYLMRKQPLDDRLQGAERVYQEQQAILEEKILSDREIKHVVAECRTLSDLLDRVGVLEYQHKKHMVELLNITGAFSIRDDRTIVLTLYIHNKRFSQVILNNRSF
jgi:site-specific DNA recombinase